MEKEIDRIIRERRSVYPVSFSGEKIDPDILLQILENANWAPTHKYTEPWRFIVFEGKGIDQFFDVVIEHTRAEKMLDPKLGGKIQKYQEYKKIVSHIVIVYMRRSMDSAIPELEEIIAVSCAIQNIYLSLQSHNVAGYLSTGMGLYSKEMQAYLNLEEQDKVLGAFLLGVPNEIIGIETKERGIVEQKIKFIR